MDTKVVPSSRCPDVRRLLAGYIEGELAPLEARRISVHLEVCRDCRREETEYRAALGALSAPREPVRPGDLFPAFAARLAADEASRRARQPLRWATAAASLLLVTALAGATWRQLGLAHNQPVERSTSAVQPRQQVRAARSLVPAVGAPAGDHTKTARAPETQPDPAATFDEELERPGPDAIGTPTRSRRTAGSGGTTRTVHRQRRAPRTRIVRGPDAGAFMEQWVANNRRRGANGEPAATYGGTGHAPRIARAVEPGNEDPMSVPMGGAPGAVASAAGPTPQPVYIEGPRGSVMRQLSDERVHVGGNWTRVRTATGFDRKGRQLVNVVIEAAPTPTGPAHPGG